MPLEPLLKRTLACGSLDVVAAAGRRYRVGDGEPPRMALALRGDAAERALARRPKRLLGAYQDGAVVLVQGSLVDLLTALDGPPLRASLGDIQRLVVSSLAFDPVRLPSLEAVRLRAASALAVDHPALRGLLETLTPKFSAHASDAEEALVEAYEDVLDRLALDADHRFADLAAPSVERALYVVQRSGCRTAVRVRAEMASDARQRVDELALFDIVTVGDAPPEPGRADRALAAAGWGTPSPATLLRAAARALKPGGSALLQATVAPTMPRHHVWLPATPGALLARLDRQALRSGLVRQGTGEDRSNDHEHALRHRQADLLAARQKVEPVIGASGWRALDAVLNLERWRLRSGGWRRLDLVYRKAR